MVWPVLFSKRQPTDALKDLISTNLSRYHECSLDKFMNARLFDGDKLVLIRLTIDLTPAVNLTQSLYQT